MRESGPLDGEEPEDMTVDLPGQSDEDPASSARAARGLFVLGAPRSGTTLVGNYLASSPSVLNLGEYGGFHLAHSIAPSALGAMPGPYREPYLRDLVVHAQWFAEGLAASHQSSWYCDSTPWNILAADRIAADMPDALFILMLRHYSGTVQSLRRSFESGFGWAGTTWAESAGVWATAYRAAGRLPQQRTLAVSFEALCADPGSTLELVRQWLEEHDYPATGLDLDQLAVSHAPPADGPRPTIGVRVDGAIELQAISSFAPEHWSGDIHRMVWPVVEDVHGDLAARFPTAYLRPAPPARLWVHHDIKGLIPAELSGNW
jgi:Sulfotransferase family